MSTVSCPQCKGLGYTTTREAKAIGRCSSGELVYSRFTAPVNRRCEACSGSGKVEGEAAERQTLVSSGTRVDQPVTVRRTRLELALLGLDGERKGAA